MDGRTTTLPDADSGVLSVPDAPEGAPRADRYSRFTQSQRRGVRIGPFGLVLEPPMLYEIVESARISPLPGVGAVCRGLINHRGNVVPVYDPAALTGEPPLAWERRRLLILNSGRDAAAMMLYGLPVQVRSGIHIPVERISGLPPVFARHARDAFREEDVYWLALDYPGFLAELAGSCLRY
jgi:chemotaxis signal transduction protein